jgi:aspartyl-tRNA(Asn)/glutamyl-tRNA(Gln) amidotransferase subunit A
VTVPCGAEMLAVEYAILLPEASSYHQESLRENADLYDPSTRVLLEVGELVLAADYLKGLRVWTLVQQAWAAMFQDVDVLVAPSMPVAAPLAGSNEIPWPDGSARGHHNRARAPGSAR